MSQDIVKTIKRELKIPLNDEQLRVITETCGRLQGVIDEHSTALEKAEEEFKAKKDEHKPAIEAAEFEKSEKCRHMKDKAAPTLVECEQRTLFAAGLVQYWHKEVMYEERPLDKDEYQREMFEKQGEEMPESGMEIPGN